MTQDEFNDALENVERSLLKRLKELMAAIEAMEANTRLFMPPEPDPRLISGPDQDEGYRVQIWPPRERPPFASVRTYGPTWITLELDRGGCEYPELMYISLN